MQQIAGLVCETNLKRILPHLERGQREYGRSVRPAKRLSGLIPLGFFVVRATRTHRVNANPLAEIEIVSGCNEGNHARAAASLVAKVLLTSVFVAVCKKDLFFLFLFGGFFLFLFSVHEQPQYSKQGKKLNLRVPIKLKRERQISSELELKYYKRLCEKCGINEVYQDIKSMNWCEECLWEFLNDPNN